MSKNWCKYNKKACLKNGKHDWNKKVENLKQ